MRRPPDLSVPLLHTKPYTSSNEGEEKVSFFSLLVWPLLKKNQGKSFEKEKKRREAWRSLTFILMTGWPNIRESFEGKREEEEEEQCFHSTSLQIKAPFSPFFLFSLLPSLSFSSIPNEYGRPYLSEPGFGIDHPAYNFSSQLSRRNDCSRSTERSDLVRLEYAIDVRRHFCSNVRITVN